MKLFNRILAPAMGVIVCVHIFLMASTGRFIGLFVNQYFPCVQNPMNSFPCFGIYDIVAVLLATIFGIIFIGIIVFKTIKFFK